MKMTKREFLTSAIAGAAAPAFAAAAGGKPQSRPLKVCVFADIHYLPGVWTNDTPEFLEKIMARAERENCDMMIHLGDLVHNVNTPLTKGYIRRYNDFKVRGYHILGNHDQDATEWRRTADAYRMPDGHYSFDRGGFRFVIADPNYFSEKPGVFVHHENGNYFRRSKNSSINWIPPEQLEWMRDVIFNSPYPCVVMSHQSFERPPVSHGVMNKEDVQAIFNEANRRWPGRVRLVINGHNHMDHLRVMDGILYWDVNSANYKWFNDPHKSYPAEYIAKHSGACHNIGWKEPLSAVLTLWPEGRVRIEGSRSEFLFGVSPKDADLPEFDIIGRYTKPLIQSADITFNYRS
ncbi:MAG: metallophosphoesterase [Kiritimatiellae bacterium]|nr:metallophosphoesterase [Kiritimatiellia bacterium]